MNENIIEINENLEILGPFLCKPTSTSMSFWFSTPNTTSAPKIMIDGYDICTCSEITSEYKNLPMTIWMGTFSNLKSNTAYSYKALIGEKELQFPNLNSDDFKFRTLRDFESADKDKFVLLSCHGVDEYEKQLKKKIGPPVFYMWDKLYQTLKGDNDIRFGFFAGDQVYMDEAFNKYLIEKSKTLKSESEIFNISYSVYKKFWSNILYRKVLARLPVFLNWDDHDLIDGWGSRDEQNVDSLKNKWNSYYEIQRECFYLMQACRNPYVNKPARQDNYYFSFEHGSSLFSIFDLRSERNKSKKEMLSGGQMRIFEKNISESKATDHFIISSVTMARMGGKIESGIGRLSNLIWSLSSVHGYEPNMMKVFMWLLLAGVALMPRALVFKYSFFSVLESLAVLIPIYFFFRYRGKFKEFFGSRAVQFLGILVVVGLLGFSSDVALTFGNIYKEGFEVNYITSVALLCLLVASVFTGKNILSSVPKFKNINLFLYFVGWVLFLILATPSTYKFSSVILSTISVVAIVFAVLEASGTVDLIAGLDDDIEDSWSSETNRAGFSWLLSVISKHKLRTTILSGDIHTAGLSQLVVEDQKVPQVVSSPVTYPVMNSAVEKITSSPKVQDLKYQDVNLKVYNLFYRSERNFCVLNKSSGQISVDYHFEDLDMPIALNNIHNL